MFSFESEVESEDDGSLLLMFASDTSDVSLGSTKDSSSFMLFRCFYLLCLATENFTKVINNRSLSLSFLIWMDIASRLFLVQLFEEPIMWTTVYYANTGTSNKHRNCYSKTILGCNFVACLSRLERFAS